MAAPVQIIPPHTNTPTTTDVPAAGSAAGALDVAISSASVRYVVCRVDVPFKWVWASSAANAVTAFAGTGHGRLPAGVARFPAGQQRGNNLYIEAESAAAITTNGISYHTENYP